MRLWTTEDSTERQDREELEAQIRAAYERILTGETDDLKIAAFEEMARLIRFRSIKQISIMEHRMGLR